MRVGSDLVVAIECDPCRCRAAECNPSRTWWPWGRQVREGSHLAAVQTPSATLLTLGCNNTTKCERGRIWRACGHHANLVALGVPKATKCDPSRLLVASRQPSARGIAGLPCNNQTRALSYLAAAGQHSNYYEDDYNKYDYQFYKSESQNHCICGDFDYHTSNGSKLLCFN